MTALRGLSFLNIFIAVVIIAAAVVTLIVITPSAAQPNTQRMLTAEQKLLQPLIVALDEAYARHLRDGEEVPISSVDQIPALLPDGRLPEGLTIAGSALRDEEGRLYALHPETADAPARFIRLSATAPASPAAPEMAPPAG